MDDELAKLLKTWSVPGPRAGLSDRIVAGVMARPSMATVVRLEVRRSLTEWRYGLGYKVAALAACLLIGVGVSMGLHTEKPQQPDLDEVAFTLGI
jgi:hypothetical protein